MAQSIAGHNFDSGILGNICSNERTIDGVLRKCGCNKVDILPTTKDDIGKPGISCGGLHTEAYQAEIEAEKERIWNLVSTSANPI